MKLDGFVVPAVMPKMADNDVDENKVMSTRIADELGDDDDLE